MTSMAKCGSRVYVATAVKGLTAVVRQLLPTTEIVDILIEEGKPVGESSVQAAGEAKVLLADPPFITALLSQPPPSLQWVQSTWAGLERFMEEVRTKKLTVPFTVTRQGDGFGRMMGEYVVGHIIACERKFRQTYQDMDTQTWAPVDKRDFRDLPDLTLGILGLGQIGREIARLCKAMGMTVWGLQRDQPSQAASSCPYIDVFKPASELKDLLSGCDYICSVLPSTPDTVGLLAGDVFQHCKLRKSVFINVGRGSVCGEESLIKALQQGWLGGAVLDVFTEEPLPRDSPLWTLPNVTITPHVAGPSKPLQVAETFVKNLKCFEEGKPLSYAVKWELGY